MPSFDIRNTFIQKGLYIHNLGAKSDLNSPCQNFSLFKKPKIKVDLFWPKFKKK